MIKKQVGLFMILSILTTNLLAQKITIGQNDTLTSVVYNRNIPLKISVPTEFGECEEEKFPLVIVLDGSSFFYSLVGMTHRFSHDKYCKITPKMIIVGVDIKNRYKELYPDIENDNFGDFLKNELIPFIDKNYPTNPFRTFIGHSMGGLRVAHTAIYEPDLFDAFIIVDGSLSEKDFEWYTVAKEKIVDYNPENKRMFVAMAQTMPPSCPQDIEGIKQDTTSHSTHMRAIIDFSERMSQKNAENKDFFSWKFYPNETHSSVTQIAMYDGFRFIYDYYYDNNWAYIMDAQTKPNDALSRFKDYFEVFGERQNTLKYPSEDYFKMYNGGFERREQTEKAKVFAKYYLDCYPSSVDAKEMIRKYE
jgi:predicted alpha/beta superfamily hydrolase